MKREDLKVGESYQDTDDEVTRTIVAIGKSNVIYDSNKYGEITSSIDFFIEHSKPISKPPKKLYAYELKNTNSIIFNTIDGLAKINYEDVSRKPEYDIVYPGGEDE